MGKAPKAPNPIATAAAQTASNKETAIAQAGLNYVNQTGPDGSIKYEQIGTWSDGTPRFQANTTLSAAGQQLQNTGQDISQNLANVGKEASGRLSGLLNAPNDWSQQQKYLNDLTNSNLDPMWARQEEQFQQSLTNRGIRPGSTAYQQQLSDFQNNKSNSYNSANLNNFTTAQQSQAALRAQPLNEILALAGGSQVQTPQFGQVNSPQLGGTDVAGITANGYNQQMAGYNANQSTLGGLFSAGASLIPLFSDVRLKTNIVKVGEHPMGFGVYEYDRIDTGKHERGVIAQEVREVRPDLVDNTHESGFLRVFYEPLGEI